MHRGDKLIRINISRNTLIAIALSLLFHALILFLVTPFIKFDNASPAPPLMIEVSLALPPSQNVIEPVLPEPSTVPVQSKPKPKPKPKPIKPPLKAKLAPKVIAQKLESKVKPVFTLPDVQTPPKPAFDNVSPPPALEDNAKVAPAKEPLDMGASIKSKQAARQAFELDAAKQNAQAVAREIGPSEDEKRNARIKNNFQNGTNGIFEITSLSGRNATFAFRGWTNDYSNARQQYFEIEAKPGQEVRLVMIKRMISLIREHYQGDFNWDSHRLGKVIILSARPEDSAGLEEFMMTEFFGPNYKNS